jgi:pre-mRNA-processing factor 19
MTQNEWDELMLETFTLKQNLDTTRQELSQALYQHDAACRVIARLMKERQEAQEALASLQQVVAAGRVANGSASASATAVTMEMDDSAPRASSVSESSTLPGDVIERINSSCAELSSGRKGRKPVAAGSLSKESIASITAMVSSFTPHKADRGAIHSLAVHPGTEASVVTGGADKDVLLSACADGRLLAKMKGHTKKINAVAFGTESSSGTVLSASADCTVRVRGLQRDICLSWLVCFLIF